MVVVVDDPENGPVPVNVVGRYPVYVVLDRDIVLGVAGMASGFDRIIGRLFDFIAETKMRNGGKIPQTAPRWMRTKPPMVSVVRIDGRRRRPVVVKRYLVALAFDGRLRAVPPLRPKDGSR
jgi:hypothetical protein